MTRKAAMRLELVSHFQQCSWLCLGAGLGIRKALVGTGWVVSLLLCMTGLKKQSSHLVQPPFLALRVFHSLGR